MNLYEMTKKYSAGKGENTMWRTLAIVSDAVEENMPAEQKEQLMRDVYNVISTGHYNEDFAREDIAKMYYVDKAGDKQYAPYWPESAVRGIYEHYKDEIPPEYNFWDFLVTMNMQASDLWCLLKRWFPDISDTEFNEKIVDAAINWLKDDDWNGYTKIWDYLNK